MKKNKKPTLESSLKSIETENWLDRVFYRRYGFFFAEKLSRTKVTPNQVTIVSFFVGMAGGAMFYFADWRMNLIGVLLLICANIMDCIDGQLARLTGIRTKLGRILDGFAGDLWFGVLYFALFFRMLNINPEWQWFFLIIVASGLSHGSQANITDYYKTFHLFLINKKKGGEFVNYEQLEAEYNGITFESEPTYKFFLFFYKIYTTKQEKATPELQNFMRVSHATYGDNLPDHIRQPFREQSKKMMKWLDMMTFNGRTPLLFLTGTIGYPFLYIYFFYEIIVLNVVRIITINRHERLCKQMTQLISAGA